MTGPPTHSGGAGSPHWPRIARLWRHLGPPLRPSPGDLAIYAEAVREGAAAPRALILGVTPELYHLPWPAGAAVTAVDSTQAMIDAVWPGPPQDASCASWTALPLPDASRDVVVCDGGIAMLRYPDQQRALADTLRRVIAPGGRFVTRLYTPGPAPPTVDDVLHALDAGAVADLNALKFRLWTALHRSVEEGVRPRDVLRVIEAHAGSLDRLAERHGWPLEHVRAMEAHRHSEARYHLSGVDEVGALFADGFTVVARRVAPGDLGACCPIVVLRRDD